MPPGQLNQYRHRARCAGLLRAIPALAIVVSFRGKLLWKDNLRQEPRWPPSIRGWPSTHTLYAVR